MLGSGLSWAALDALRKLLVARVRPIPLSVLLALGQLPLFLSWLAVSDDTRVEPAYIGPGTASVAINLAAFVLFLRAVQVSPLSVTVPVLSFTPVFSALFAAGLLREIPGPQQIVGMSLVTAGALLLNLRREDPTTPLGMLRAFGRERGSLLMMVVALLWSLGATVDKLALFHAGVPVHAAVQTAGVGLVPLAYLASRRRLDQLRAVRSAKAAYLAALVVAGLALALQFLALRLVLVSFVETVKRGIGMALAVINGSLLFGEPLTLTKVAAIVAMTIGVALILV
jgi:drug/metabolite transporter (DMT)-like permease